MNCPHCKKNIPDGVVYCPECGQTVSSNGSGSQEVDKYWDKAQRENERADQIRKTEIIKEERAKKNKAISMMTAVIAIVIVSLLAVYSLVLRPNIQYTSAMELMEAEKYSEAAMIFESIENHKDSAERLNECRYYIAEAFYVDGNFSEALSIFNKLTEIKNSKNYITLCENEIQYQKADALFFKGEYIEAIEAFAPISDYKDASNKIIESKKEWIKTLSRGDIVSFGQYEQDCQGSNGKETVQWYILDKNESGDLLVISEVVLNVYNSDCSIDENKPWEKQSVRTWLNSEFVNELFSFEEQELIITTTISTPANEKYGVSGGNNTSDKLFFLSMDEVKEFYVSEDERKVEWSPYADSEWDYWRRSGDHGWMLRSPGKHGQPVIVNNYGKIYDESLWLGKSITVGIRPAMWISIDNEKAAEFLGYYKEVAELEEES